MPGWETDLVEQGGVVAAGDGADSVDVARGAGHVEIVDYQQQRRAHPQVLVHVLVVGLQEGVPGQRGLLLQAPACEHNLILSLLAVSCQRASFFLPRGPDMPTQIGGGSWDSNCNKMRMMLIRRRE